MSKSVSSRHTVSYDCGHMTQSDHGTGVTVVQLNGGRCCGAIHEKKMFGSVHPEAGHVEAYFSPVTKYQSGIINECMPLVSVHLLDHSGTQSMEYARKRLKS